MMKSALEVLLKRLEAKQGRRQLWTKLVFTNLTLLTVMTLIGWKNKTLTMEGKPIHPLNMKLLLKVGP